MVLVNNLLKAKKAFKSLKKLDKKYIFRNKLDKACIHHDMAYEDF